MRSADALSEGRVGGDGRAAREALLRIDAVRDRLGPRPAASPNAD